MTTYYCHDPASIFIKVKVNLVPAGDGTWDDVKKIKKLEDAIEKHASRKGFILNLVFVNSDNKPEFVADAGTVTINANPKWPDATNWGENARTNATNFFMCSISRWTAMTISKAMRPTKRW